MGSSNARHFCLHCVLNLPRWSRRKGSRDFIFLILMCVGRGEGLGDLMIWFIIQPPQLSCIHFSALSFCYSLCQYFSSEYSVLHSWKEYWQDLLTIISDKGGKSTPPALQSPNIAALHRQKPFFIADYMCVMYKY